MKKLLLSCIALAMLLSSCGSRESEVKDFVFQAVTALKNGDKSTIWKMYPNAANVDNFATEFNTDSIKVEEDKMTGGYKISLGNENWLVVTGEDKESFKIVNSRGLFAYQKEQMDFAQNTGWISPEMDDQEIQRAFTDTLFFDFLYDKTVEQLKKNVTAAIDWNKTDIKYMTEVNSTIVAKITNNGSRKIMGGDYKVSMWSDMEGTKTAEGKDIAPQETIYLSTRFPAEGSARQTYNAAIKFNLDGISKRDVVSRYYEVKGGEYQDYLKTK